MSTSVVAVGAVVAQIGAHTLESVKNHLQVKLDKQVWDVVSPSFNSFKLNADFRYGGKSSLIGGDGSFKVDEELNSKNEVLAGVRTCFPLSRIPTSDQTSRYQISVSNAEDESLFMSNSFAVPDTLACDAFKTIFVGIDDIVPSMLLSGLPPPTLSVSFWGKEGQRPIIIAAQVVQSLKSTTSTTRKRKVSPTEASTTQSSSEKNKKSKSSKAQIN